MRILVLGATGPSGLYIVRQALKEGYDVAVYARSTHKLPDDLSDKVEIIQGSFEYVDKDKLKRALKGRDAVLSALGPPAKFTFPFFKYKVGGLLTEAYKLIIECMQEEHVDRLIALGTVSQQFPEDGRSVRCATLVWGIQIAREAYLDVVGMGQVIPDRCEKAGIRWTIVRVGVLSPFGPDEGEEVDAGYIGQTGVLLRRTDFARFVLKELKEEKWLGKAPVICSKVWL